MDQDLQGKIGRFTLPEILQLISQSRKTGTLGMQKDDDIVMVYFRKGQIIYGYGPRQTYHLGELLRAKGKITSEQLSEAVRMQAKSESSKRLGQILIDKGYIGREDLESMVRIQVEELIYSLLTWESGSFKFYENQYPTEEEITVDIPVDRAVLEGSRRLDEMNRAKEILPDPASILSVKPLSPEKRTEISLQPEEWNLLGLVNGRRTAMEIAGLSGLSDTEALRKLGTLKLSGLVTSSDKKEAESDRLAAMVDRLAGLFEEYLADKSRKTSNERTTIQALKDSKIPSAEDKDEF